MKITDRPGRYCAIFIFSPTLFVCGIINIECNIYISFIFFLFSTTLFCYEIYWISFTQEEIAYTIISSDINHI